MYVDAVLPLKCPYCESVLKPDIVLFEEALPQKEWARAMELASSCDLMFIVGTSLNVFPANTLPYCARGNDAVLVEITLKKHGCELVNFSLKGISCKHNATYR
jgi:NAD-dependent deacetylase